MLHHFNSAHKNIQFTIEHELHDHLNFSDLNVKNGRWMGTIEKSIYNEET